MSRENFREFHGPQAISVGCHCHKDLLLEGSRNVLLDLGEKPLGAFEAQAGSDCRESGVMSRDGQSPVAF
jgi:hypothetical protein